MCIRDRVKGVSVTERVNSDPKRIQKAYRTILLKNHPDKGGSPYLAAKVNQAKDILLGNTEAEK